jgi:hypothetical protein
MIGVPSGLRIYLALERCGMRKVFNGLALAAGEPPKMGWKEGSSSS